MPSSDLDIQAYKGNYYLANMTLWTCNVHVDIKVFRNTAVSSYSGVNWLKHDYCWEHPSISYVWTWISCHPTFIKLGLSRLAGFMQNISQRLFWNTFLMAVFLIDVWLKDKKKINKHVKNIYSTVCRTLNPFRRKQLRHILPYNWETAWILEVKTKKDPT